jgi:hypothetical protein
MPNKWEKEDGEGKNVLKSLLLDISHRMALIELLLPLYLHIVHP